MPQIALLTSSRADYSIYYPLINEIQTDGSFDLDIIAFGNHNSMIYGNSSDRIEEDGFKLKYKVYGFLYSMLEIFTKTKVPKTKAMAYPIKFAIKR